MAFHLTLNRRSNRLKLDKRKKKEKFPGCVIRWHYTFKMIMREIKIEPMLLPFERERMKIGSIFLLLLFVMRFLRDIARLLGYGGVGTYRTTCIRFSLFSSIKVIMNIMMPLYVFKNLISFSVVSHLFCFLHHLISIDRQRVCVYCSLFRPTEVV